MATVSLPLNWGVLELVAAATRHEKPANDLFHLSANEWAKIDELSDSVRRRVIKPLMAASDINELKQIFPECLDRYQVDRYALISLLMHKFEDNATGLREMNESISNNVSNLLNKKNYENADPVTLATAQAGLKYYLLIIENLARSVVSDHAARNSNAPKIGAFNYFISFVAAYELCLLAVLFHIDGEIIAKNADVPKILAEWGKTYIIRAFQMSKLMRLVDFDDNSDIDVYNSSAEEPDFARIIFEEYISKALS